MKLILRCFFAGGMSAEDICKKYQIRLQLTQNVLESTLNKRKSIMSLTMTRSCAASNATLFGTSCWIGSYRTDAMLHPHFTTSRNTWRHIPTAAHRFRTPCATYRMTSFVTATYSSVDGSTQSRKQIVSATMNFRWHDVRNRLRA